MKKNVFRSRISVLIVLFILATLTPVVISVFRYPAPIKIVIFSILIAIIAALFTGIRYIVSDGRLLFKIWWIRAWSLPTADIRSIRRSYNLLSSPAASLKRLRITMGRHSKFQWILLSPVREREFIDTLRAANPDIKVDVPETRSFRRIQDWDF